MNKKNETEENHIEKTFKKQIIDNILIDKNPTNEEFENFLQKTEQIQKIVKKLSSSDTNDQKLGKILADEILRQNKSKEISETAKLTIKSNRTVINKFSSSNCDQSQIDQEIFKKYVEKDARERAENRKAKNDRAETLKRIANDAFKEKNYEKAVTYFNKALEERKDSIVLWNNRALSYMRLGLFEKALDDFNWTLKLNDSNLKALLNSAKCWKYLRNKTKSDEYLEMAAKSNPKFKKFIEDFKNQLEVETSM